MARYPLAASTPPTPFYAYDMALLGQTLAACLAEASVRNFRVHYALKANVEGPILQAIAAAGFGADCVSGWEVEAALAHGFKPDQVVFAGVGKSDNEMRSALRSDIFCFNCESLAEIEVLNELALEEGRTARIALRLNPDVEPDTHKYIATGQAESKFGIAFTEVEEALARLKDYKALTLVGLHFHIGSGILNFSGFERLCERVNEFNAWFAQQGVRIEHLNMGGGLGIDYADPDGGAIPNFAAYFDVFSRGLKPLAGQTIHFELGRSLVGQCGELITRVLYTKRTASGERFVIVDAGMTELIRPALYGASHRIENLSGAGRPSTRVYIGGPICESSDVFAYDIEFPETMRGDLLAIRSCGAYGSIMRSHYNLRPTAASYFL